MPVKAGRGAGEELGRGEFAQREFMPKGWCRMVTRRVTLVPGHGPGAVYAAEQSQATGRKAAAVTLGAGGLSTVV